MNEASTAIFLAILVIAGFGGWVGRRAAEALVDWVPRLIYRGRHRALTR